MFKVPEHCRIMEGPLASNAKNGHNGAFLIEIPQALARKNPFACYLVIASDGMGWEHVSITFFDNHKSVKQSLPYTPSWNDMCFIKSVFWDKEDAVIQFHPPESMYINNHPNCLHLWKPTNKEIPLPHPILVGVKGYTVGERGQELMMQAANEQVRRQKEAGATDISKAARLVQMENDKNNADNK